MDPRPLLLTSALVLWAAFSPSVVKGVSQCKIKWSNLHEIQCNKFKVLPEARFWLFGISCPEVSERLVGQIQAWQIQESCLGAGESCSYELVSTSPYLIKATHTSPDTRKVSNLQFLLEQSTVCRMTGEAAIEIIKAPSDNSTNYCSLQNLIDGSELNNTEGYKQFSNKWICPGFDTSNCTFQ